MDSPITLRSPRYEDERGWFQSSYDEVFPQCLWVMHNISHSVKNTIRGLHYQLPFAQNKLVTVLQGSITDIILDVDPDSPSYGQWSKFKLSSDDEDLPNQLFVPSNFAHGFSVHSETAMVSYLTDQAYHPYAEHSINPLSSVLDLPWGVEVPIMSTKDAQALDWSAVKV
ncbi:MAG: dTDP-4-dehydrorhamnose 3,5-epimerase family protein [Akkermansiaceae bacterium]